MLYIYYICLPDSHPDVEAQQVADHSRHGGQDDDPSDVVDQRVHSQTQQAERSIQLLEQVRVTQDNPLFEIQQSVRSQHDRIQINVVSFSSQSQ